MLVPLPAACEDAPLYSSICRNFMVHADKMKQPTPPAKAAANIVGVTFGIQNSPLIIATTPTIAATTPIQPRTNRNHTIIDDNALNVSGIAYTSLQILLHNVPF